MSFLFILLKLPLNVISIELYRPICLLNVIYIYITKVGTNRVTSIAHRVIKTIQHAFIPRRNILEGMVLLHETIHEFHKKNLDGVIFKINFEKTYDKVKWVFFATRVVHKRLPTSVV
jgi:hypothetical protein